MATTSNAGPGADLGRRLDLASRFDDRRSEPPFDPPGRADQLRAKHLPDIKVSMLFVQGSRDAFGTPDELRPIIKELKAPAELSVVEGGDHSFKVLKRSGIAQEDTYKAMLDRIETWLRRTFAN